MKNFLIFAILISSMSFLNKVFSQAPGTLDPGFATNGELADSLIFPYRNSALALSPGSEFVVTSATHDTIQIIRYTSNGSRDINFGSNSAGYVQIVTPGFTGTVITSIVQTDQKILIAGQYAVSGTNQKAYILRVNADGTVDNSFGTNGWFFFNFFPVNGESIRQIALQNNGNIVAVDAEGYTGITDTFVVTRIKSNGTYDSSFAVNGQYQVPFYNFLATSPSTFQLDADNNFTFAAYSNYQASDYFYLFRLNQSGQLDTTFGKSGNILIDSANIINGGANLGLNFQSDGKLITVQSKQTGDLLWAVCRYNINGTADSSFGTNGMVNVQPNLFPIPYSVENIVQVSTGQIITAGIVNVAGSNRLMVNAFNPDGGTDASFGNNEGSELLNCFELDDIVYNLLVTPDNKILINGLINELNYQQFEIVRLIGSTATSVKQLSGNIGFSVYPNPANTQVSFEFPKLSNGIISLRDITGNIVMSVSTGNSLVQTMDISQLAAGIYIISRTDSENTISEKLVKQ